MRRQLMLPALCFIMGLLGVFCGQALFGQGDVVLHWPGSTYYTDISDSSPHDEDIGYAREAGIARGYSETEYGPDWNVSREQMATFEVRDFTAGMVTAVKIVGLLDYTPYTSTRLLAPPDWDEITVEEWFQRNIDLLSWSAELIEYQADTRPEDCAGGALMYSDVARHIRDKVALMEVWAEQGP